MATEVQGMRGAKAAFQAMPEVFRERLNDATETTVREIARIAKARLQASPSIRTRALFNAVAWSMSRKAGRGKAGIARVTSMVASGVRGELSKTRVKGIVIPGKGGSALKSQGAKTIVPTKYSHHVEFGTRHMQAEPFMIPATEAEKNNYLARCMKAGKQSEQDLANIGSRNL